INMLTTKEAIEKRRSIRKFKPDSIPDEHIRELLNSARLAPSGCNAQPWRFKIVKDAATKAKLAKAAFDQSFIGQAPVVIVCCADVQGYFDGTVSGAQDLGKIGAVEGRIVTILEGRAEAFKTIERSELAPRIASNVAIAIEHIVLRALDFGLGTCWIRLFKEQMVKDVFGWNDNIYVVALMPIGYPAEAPDARKRLGLNEIIIE
ncbi:MAG: nitroreductase family protein, partial [Gammaproteobacteria bacterium]|nr:nitroreductase family protein [Gammaproteobacteria bacterium]